MLHITPMDLIMTLCFWLCVLVNFVTLYNLSKHQKGLLLGVTLPDAARTWGVGMDHYLQGDFYVIGDGEAQFCLDPTQKLFLRVETTDPAGGTTVYWFTGETDAKTKAVGEWLESRLVPAE